MESVQSQTKDLKMNTSNGNINVFPNQKKQQCHQGPYDKTLPLFLQQQQVKGNGDAAKNTSSEPMFV